MLCFPANFLRINVYLTQKISEDMLWNIAVNDAGAEYDPLTLLRSRTMFGRPDWQGIYKTMRQAIESGQYLPGSNAQLKTKVGVSIRHLDMFCKWNANYWFIDLFLWTWCLGQSHKGGYS
jgi:NADPH oxidase